MAGVERPFATSAAITAVAIGYSNPIASLIADDVLPRLPVAGEKFKWTEYPIAENFTFPETLVGRTGRVNRVTFSGTEKTDAINDHGLEDAIPYSDIQEADEMRRRGLGVFDPVLVATAGLTNLILLDREVRVAAIVQDPDNYPAGRNVVLSGSDKFSDYEGSDPITVLKAAFNGTVIFRPNTMSMSREVWSVLSSHPKIVNAIKGNVTGQGIVSPAEFVQLFSGEGLRKLAIGDGFVNRARKGQVEEIARVWGNSIQLTFIDPNIRPEQGGMTWGFTAEYGKRIGGSWEDRNIGLQGGTVVRIGERVREVVVAREVGFQLRNVI